MIGAVFRLSWLNLRRDRMALILSFVLPVAFFSIFAAVFGAMDRGTRSPINAVLAWHDTGGFSRELADALVAEPRLRIVKQLEPRLDPATARRLARDLVRTGVAAVAIVIPSGFDDAIETEESARVELLADTANPIAVETVGGLLQAGVLNTGYRVFAEEASEGFENAGGEASVANPDSGPLQVEVVDVLGGGDKHPSTAYFAAGLGVMFLLFSLSGRSAILIEEKESGVLGRMLSSQLTMTQLLAGRWLFLVAIGSAQVSLMFLWGAAVFDLELFTLHHVAGFGVMTLASAAAAAAFGLLLAAACRTRAQLNGIAVVVVLIMSALGGSMFPRFLMPELLQQVGLVTFNAWALDGFQKVFWYEVGLADLGPQVGVLLGVAAAFFLTARLLARRWEHI